MNYEMSIPRMDDKIQKQDIYDNLWRDGTAYTVGLWEKMELAK